MYTVLLSLLPLLHLHWPSVALDRWKLNPVSGVHHFVLHSKPHISQNLNERRQEEERTAYIQCSTVSRVPIASLQPFLSHTRFQVCCELSLILQINITQCFTEENYHQWKAWTLTCLPQQTQHIHVLHSETVLQLKPLTVFCEYLSKHITVLL